MWHTHLTGQGKLAKYLPLLIALVALVALAVTGGTAQAQGGETVVYGTAYLDEITAENPFAIYTVPMNAGDMLNIVVVGLATDMAPTIGMVGPDQLPISQSDDDPSSDRLARLEHRAIQTGNHTLIITNATNAIGQFFMTVDGRPTPPTTPLALNTPQTINLPVGASPVAFTFQPSANSSTLLNINTNTSGFSFLARVYDGRGHLIAKLSGLDMRGVAINIGPGSGDYIIEVGTLTPDVPGTVQISTAPGGEGQTAGVPDIVTPAITATPTVCQVTSDNRVNVRSGPSTAYPSFGSLMPNTSLNVVGRNSMTTWYVVDYSGRQGWVSASVVAIGGPCGALPFVPDPPLPVTPTPVPTTTPTAPSVSFTSTVADGVAYPPGTCFTFYWTVTNINSVYFDGQGVTGQGQREVCPTASRSYVLRVIYNDGSTHDFTIPVSISAP